MKRFVSLVAAMLLYTASWAQVNLSGLVKSNDDEPLVGANVKLIENQQITTTDASGKFAFKDLKTGTYHVLVSFVGFSEQETEVALSSSKFLEIKLISTPLLGEEIIVKGSRASTNTPIAYSNVKADDYKSRNMGQDITYLMQLTPSVVTSSDGGNGVGYTSIRVRGTDANRINVTVDGIPMNDAESQGLYWVDLPDFASSVDNIQIQRGVGTSTNGAGAFGATFNLQTQNFNDKAYAEINSAAGSFNTFKNTVMVGSGLIDKHFTFDARLSSITSDGYIDRSSSNLKSYYLSGAYHTEKTIVRLVHFAGTEKTHQAWTGVPTARLNNDKAGMYEYLYNSDLNLYNPEDEANILNSGRTYNPYLYANQTDNYLQQHYQLHVAHQFNKQWSVNGALHYTYGEGYYEDLKNYAKLSKYNLPSVTVGSDSVITKVMGIPSDYVKNGQIVKTDLVRQKWMKNDFYGFVGSANYTLDKIKTTFGGGYNVYDGRHFGYVIWSRYTPLDDNQHEYYRSTGLKKDWNAYIRSEYSPIEQLTVFADLQERGISHDIKGLSDKRVDITQKHEFNFFNPKFGVSYKITDNWQAYASWGRSHREPNRNNYVDADSGKWPTAECLDDFEAGIRMAGEWWNAEINSYYMLYNNQLVLTGAINETGDAIMTNVKDSYRKGLEISAGAKPLKWMELSGCITLSKNKIKDFTEYVDDWDNGGQQSKYLGTTDLSFSPNLIWNGRVKVTPFQNFNIEALVRHVGDQYTDNTSSSARKLDAYTVTDLLFSYKILPHFAKYLTVNFMINNVLDADYISNAWVYRFYYNGVESALDGNFPQAFRNYMIGFNLRF
jgi:iron complex outermembrane receptor protein